MHCNIENFLNYALRNPFVDFTGRQHRKDSSTEAELTLEKTCEITQAIEMAGKYASELKSEETKPGVNVLKSYLEK